jgi:hypothetical protein
VLELDHPDEPPHGPQAFACYNHYSKHACSVPLVLCAGLAGALVTAGLRPGPRPTGAENARLVGRRLAFLRRPWPRPPSLVRGDSPGATPAVLAGRAHRPRIAVGCGLAGQTVLRRHAAPVLPEARRLPPPRTARAQAHPARPPDSRRL